MNNKQKQSNKKEKRINYDKEERYMDFMFRFSLGEQTSILFLVE